MGALQLAEYAGGRMMPVEIIRRGLLRPKVTQEERAAWLVHQWASKEPGREGDVTVQHHVWLCSTGELAATRHNRVLQPVLPGAFARTTETHITQAVIDGLRQLAARSSG